jgi:cysteine desulfurase family protein (TIGR01976 family)
MSAAATSVKTAPFNLAARRKLFPALARRHADREAVFFDGPAGSQVPESVIEAISRYLRGTNANHGGVFATAVESDALLDDAHEAAADFVGATDPSGCYFGANMTTLTFALSRALARTWRTGDEVIVSRLDHDADVTPWTMAAADVGAVVRHIGIRPDCTLDLDELHRILSPRTRLVAVGCASNAVGTVNPVAEITAMAHAVGAKVFLDAVHYAPHRRIDVAGWGCDFLAASAYKFFGPHVGLVWGRPDLLEELTAYKVRPSSNELPGKWMTGTQNHEGIAGVLAAIEYLADLGRASAAAEGADPAGATAAGSTAAATDAGQTSLSRPAALDQAFRAIDAYERTLGARLQTGLDRLPQFQSFGITEVARFAERVPTFSIRHRTLPSIEVARRLAQAGIFAWHGNFYALPLTETLGVEPEGLVRLGLLHYNTEEEVDYTLEVLRTIA